MAQSLSKVYLHYVFSVKNRENTISKIIQNKLHSFIVGVYANLGSYVAEIYANSDHIHILCTLPRTITIADLISKVKSASSKWMKKNGVPDFTWQNGYGVFSVSSSKLETVKKYIQNQEQHHKKMTFKEEFRLFLKKYNVEYDEKYVWD